jgi:cyclohexadienyl dehydratase
VNSGRRSALCVALATTALTATACAATPPTPRAAPEAGLRVCTTGDYKPATYRDPRTGRYSGIDIEMARSLGAYLKRDVTFVPTTWPTLMKDLATKGKCEITMGGVSITPERRKTADFTRPYLNAGKIPLTTTAQAPHLRTLDQIDRKGVRVIVNPGGTNEAFVKKHFAKATVVAWPDNVTIFDQILAGKADVMITDALEAEYQAKLHPGLTAVNPDKPFNDDRKAYMLPKGSGLTAKADQWLERALKDGTFQRSYTTWMNH